MKNDIILVASRTPDMAFKLKGVLEQELFNVTDTCYSGNEALRKVSIYKPDLLVTDFELGDMTGLQVAEIILNSNSSSVILFANQMQKDYAEQYFKYPYLICLNKPINRAVFINTVEISLKSRKSIKNLEAEIEKLKDDIESRKYIERAKGLLMEKLKLSEEEAYARLRKQSMDMQLGMKQVAQVIINTMKK